MGYFAVGGIVVMLLVEMVVNFHQLTRALAERRAKLKLQEFEAVLAERNVDPQQSRKFFSGEVVLEQDIAIVIPVFIEYEELVGRYQVPIVTALNDAGLVEDTRAYTMVNNCGIDLRLNDFVSGVELLITLLIRLEIPRGSLIEYAGGDLPVYED